MIYSINNETEAKYNEIIKLIKELMLCNSNPNIKGFSLEFIINEIYNDIIGEDWDEHYSPSKDSLMELKDTVDMLYDYFIEY